MAKKGPKKNKIKTIRKSLKNGFYKFFIDRNQQTIALAGCLRSGTNYAKTLLELNFKCTVKNDIFGWKHGLIPIITPYSPIQKKIKFDHGVFVTKNPFSFLVSLFNYFDEFKLNIKGEEKFSDFISSRIIIFDSNQDNSPELRFSNPIELWNVMNWNYLSCQQFIHINYEDLLDNPQKIILDTAHKIDAIQKKGEFKNPSKKVKRLNDGQDLHKLKQYESKNSFNKNEYMTHQYMSSFNQSDIDFVLKNIDDELVNKLGYSQLLSSLTQRKQTT